MPFTFSHPAAVLPLLSGGRGRGPLIASALVAGSLAPDLPFFADSLLPGSYALGGTTHRLWAVPTVDVAIAAGLAASWHGLLREPLTALLPAPWADRADALTAPRRKHYGRSDAAWFAASAAIGAASHLGWDSFTHHGRAGVRRFPVLNREVGGMPGYLALQWSTSAVGLAVLAAAAARALRAPEQVEPRPALPSRTRRRAVGLLAASAAAGAVHRSLRDLSGRPGASALVAVASFGGGAGALAGAALYAAGTRLTDRRRPAERSIPERPPKMGKRDAEPGPQRRPAPVRGRADQQ
ncbi:DUF4184 family protein [Streptacidiphilus sp. N1-3]|uniref:DUF4184 family protein n=1 Tax=Streptacidiphilus alkalitolerans TaxID=3342712 RepID=A0ABV6WWS5_9ACTN